MNTTKIEKKLMAYQVREDGEGYCCIVFATNGATARREGANELDTDWECIESCRRVQNLDQYAPGPVPPMTLIELGWWFECSHCGRSVHKDMAEEIEDEGLNPDDFSPRANGNYGVFCSASCEGQHCADKAANAAARKELEKLVLEKFPGAMIKRIHVYGTKLEPTEKGHGGIKCSAEFTFPGAKYGATFIYGENECFVATADVEAFKALYAKSKEVA